jgi:vitamin B12 transporter
VASLFTRGTESDHTLMVFDGVRLNSPYFGGFDWSQLPVAGLERIEVARGPFSALWGGDAIGGVVNVVPRRAAGGFGVELAAEGGQDDWRRLAGTVSWGDGRFDVLATAFDREGDAGTTNSDFSTTQLLVNAGWSWADGGRVAVLAQDVDAEAGIPFLDPLTPSPDRRQRSRQKLVAVPFAWRLTGSWDLRVTASHVDRELVFSDPSDPFGFTSSETNAATDELRVVSRHELGRHRIGWGAEWRSDKVTDVSTFGSNLSGADQQVRSAWAQDSWSAGRIDLLAGVRWDDTRTWGSRLSPRLHLGIDLGSGLELRAGWGEAFRPPAVGELYFPFSGNPGLEPESSRSWEIGLGWLPASGSSRWQLTAFDTSVDDLIEYDFARLAFANVASATMRGVEASIETVVRDGVRSALSTTWLDTAGDDGLPLLRRPEWSGSWTVTGALGRRWRGDLSLVWVGARDDIDPVTFERVRLDDHLTVHLAVAAAVAPGTEITVRVVNLLDRAYQEVAGYPAPGRRLTAGLRWRP